MGTVASVIIGLLMIGGAVALVVRARRSARQKGYRSPFVGIGIYGGFFAGLILAANLFDSLDRSVSNLVFGASCAGVALLEAAVVRILPGKSARRSGPRTLRFPYRAVGWTMMCGSVLFPTALILFDADVEAPFRLSFPMFGVGALSLSIAIRAAATRRRENDSRPPVLYLRPFKKEGEVFAEIFRRPKDYYTPPPDNWFHDRRFPTFEQFFSADLRLAIGPLVALGNPEDFVPPTAALPRKYASDADWQHEFRSLAANAACILATVEPSDNLLWEFETLRQSGRAEKLFLITRPKSDVSRESRLRYWVTMLLTARFSVTGVKRGKPPAWPEIVKAMGRAGYTLPRDNPGAGAVIAFDSECRAVVLCSGARRSRDYIEAIQRRLERTRAAGA